MKAKHVMKAMLVALLFVALCGCGRKAAPPTPDIEATIQARLAEEAARQTAVAQAVQQTLAAQPTPLPPTPLPPTATAAPTLPPPPTLTPAPTPTPAPPGVLTVKVTTGNVKDAGTDDDVYLDIGTAQWSLDNPGVNDFERGSKDVFMVARGVRKEDIKQIALRKSPDGLFGGWFLEGIEVFLDDELIYRNDHINLWIENDTTLVWTAPDYPAVEPGRVVELAVEIATGDVKDAGTDDDVTFYIGTRKWNLDTPDYNDFERGDIQLYPLYIEGVMTMDDLREIRICKAPDGLFGGWYLARIRLWVNGKVFREWSVERWIENETTLCWSLD